MMISKIFEKVGSKLISYWPIWGGLIRFNWFVNKDNKWMFPDGRDIGQAQNTIVRSTIAILGRWLATVLVICSCPGYLQFLKYLIIFGTSEGDVCFLGRHIGRVIKKEASILEWWLQLSKFECGENLFSRSDTNKFAMSRLDDARELSGYRKRDIYYFLQYIFIN
jgi:hypothetical protein